MSDRDAIRGTGQRRQSARGLFAYFVMFQLSMMKKLAVQSEYTHTASRNKLFCCINLVNVTRQQSISQHTQFPCAILKIKLTDKMLSL